jgi:SAM-dependent methyltransferase
MSLGTRPDEVLWHEVECGGYQADLALWDELAEEAAGPVLELGCGAGRVCVHLARAGHEVTGLDRDADMLAAARGRADGLGLELVAADVTQFELGPERFSLILAPMQLLQLLEGSSARRACLAAVTRHLRPGGRVALAIVDRVPPPDPSLPPLLPDVREFDGWVYSSLPVDALVEPGRISIRRLRQVVSPAGELRDEQAEVRLLTLSVDELEAEAEDAGLHPLGRRTIAATDAHVGSVVVLLEKEAA